MQHKTLHPPTSALSFRVTVSVLLGLLFVVLVAVGFVSGGQVRDDIAIVGEIARALAVIVLLLGVGACLY